MKRGTIPFLCILLMLTLSACGPSEADLAATNDAIHDTEEAIEKTEEAEDAEATAAQQTAEMFATQENQTQAAATAQARRDEGRTATAEQATAAAATQEYLQVATQTAEAAHMYEIIQALSDNGVIYRTEGTFVQLPEFEYSMAQIFWLRNFQVPDITVRDFVIFMDVSWESASSTAEFYGSGCGISFRRSDDGSEYYSFMLSLDGNMNFFQALSSSNQITFSKAWFGTLDHMSGRTAFIVVADGTTYQVFNENLERIDIRYGEALREGGLAYLVSSGTNVDFGTRCVFNDVELWQLDE